MSNNKITLSKMVETMQEWQEGEEIGKSHIMVKTGSVIVVTDTVDEETGIISDKEVILNQDICVYVENDRFKITEPKRK